MANKIPWSATQYSQQLERREEIDNLYVFGYPCKIFRDEEKAGYIDRGQHLIPWMGDSELLIDRYDGRGHLHDLQAYDADRMSVAARETPEEDRAIEKLIDEERYMELHTDVAEQNMYEEEELKRLNEEVSDPYSAIGFTYNEQQQQQQQQAQLQKEKSEDEEGMEPYEAPVELKIPKGVTMPPNVKMGAIIEKTAAFVGEHGGQMEIVIKTKQKNNPQFGFMNLDNELNPFYRYLTKMIKSGKYRPQLKPKPSESRIEGDQHYLHPSLARTPVEAPQSHEAFINSAVSKLPAGQIANTAYAKLLNNLSKHTGRNSPQPQHKPQPVVAVPPVHVKKNCVANYGNTAGQETGNGVSLVGYEDTPHTLPGIGHMPLSEPHPNQPPPPGTEPLPPGTEPAINHGSASPTNEPAPSPSLPVIIDQHGRQITTPPSELQVVIDRMAQYVIKNGPDFETVVRNKTDDRFDFLNSWSVHYLYYEHKKRAFAAELESEEASLAVAGVSNDTAASEDEHEVINTSRAISFSLRGKEVEPAARTTYRAVLYDSDDEPPEPTPIERISIDYHHQSSGPAEDRPLTPPPKDDAAASEAEEKRQADSRLRDKLALAAREKLAQTSKDEQVKAERKRKAAMFINMLKSSNPTKPAKPEKIEPPIIGPALPPPGCTPNISPRSSRSNSPLPAAFRDVSPRPTSVSPRSTSPLARVAPSHAPRITKRSLSRSRSRSKSPLKRKYSSRTHPRSRRSRSRSRSRRSRSRHSRSRSPSRRSHRKRSRTPPSAYNTTGRRSPVHIKHRGPIPTQYRDRHKEHSLHKPPSSKSKSSHPSKARKRSRSRSRSRSKKISKSSKSKQSSRATTRRKSRSRSRDKKKSKHSSSKYSSRHSSRSPKRHRGKDRDCRISGSTSSKKPSKMKLLPASDSDSDLEVVSVNVRPDKSRKVTRSTSSGEDSSKSSVYNGIKDIHEVADSSNESDISPQRQSSERMVGNGSIPVNT